MSLNQAELCRILALAAHPEIKLLLSGRVTRIRAAVALRLARSGQYEWCGSKHRVRKMRPLVERLPWVACYRTTESPTLQPSIEFCRHLRS